MGLADRLEYDAKGSPRYSVPKEFQPYVNWDGMTGQVQTPPMVKPMTDFSDFLRSHDLDPELVEIVGQIGRSRWQNGARDKETGELIWLTSHKFNIRARMESIDLPSLFAAASRATYVPPVSVGTGGAAVVVWADPQTGKSGSRGGVSELIDRVSMKQAKLADWLTMAKPSSCLFADVGDGIEGFENVSSQQFTNGLSLPDQIDLEATFEFGTINLMTRFAPTKAAKVPSNHGAWRKGKGTLGRAGDDWGIHIGKRLRHTFGQIGTPVDWAFPLPDDQTLAVDVNGTILGMQHGHMVNRPEAMPDWWARQVHGAQPIAHADILVTGHFHHFRCMPTGRNPYTGRSKWWVQAPTLDNGSDWYRNLRGDDSDPGLLVFMVDNEGFNLSSVTIL